MRLERANLTFELSVAEALVVGPAARIADILTRAVLDGVGQTARKSCEQPGLHRRGARFEHHATREHERERRRH